MASVGTIVQNTCYPCVLSTSAVLSTWISAQKNDKQLIILALHDGRYVSVYKSQLGPEHLSQPKNRFEYLCDPALCW